MDSSATGDFPMLVMTTPMSMRYPMTAEQIVIGRDPDCDLIVPDRRVSRRHAEIVRREEDFILRDRDSKNGTFVNGDRITEEYRLQDGDEIEIALCCQLIFVGPGATAPLSVESPQDNQPGPVALSVDAKSHRAWIGDEEILPPLSLAQFRLLHLLWTDPGRVFSREEVAVAVWPGDESEGISEQAIDAVVRRLRERLTDSGADEFVVTVRGHGFRLMPPARL
jgi:predicted component of type VI protein secretion system